MLIQLKDDAEVQCARDAIECSLHAIKDMAAFTRLEIEKIKPKDWDKLHQDLERDEADIAALERILKEFPPKPAVKESEEKPEQVKTDPEPPPLAGAACDHSGGSLPSIPESPSNRPAGGDASGVCTMEEFEESVKGKCGRVNEVADRMGISQDLVREFLATPGCKVKRGDKGWLRYFNPEGRETLPIKEAAEPACSAPVVDTVVMPSRGAEGNGTVSLAEGKAQALPVGGSAQLSPTLSGAANGPAPSAGAVALIPLAQCEYNEDIHKNLGKEWTPKVTEAQKKVIDKPVFISPTSNEAENMDISIEPDMSDNEFDNSKWAPTDHRSVRLGFSLQEPFSATDLRARLDGEANRAYEWLAAWKRKSWIETCGFNQYRRSAKFGQ